MKKCKLSALTLIRTVKKLKIKLFAGSINRSVAAALFFKINIDIT